MISAGCFRETSKAHGGAAIKSSQKAALFHFIFLKSLCQGDKRKDLTIENFLVNRKRRDVLSQFHNFIKRGGKAMEGLIKGFLGYLRRAGAADNTIIGYRSDLNLFIKFLSAQFRRIEIREINGKIISGYLDDLKRRRFSEATISRKFAAFKSFFSYLIDEGVIETNPLEGMMSPGREAKARPQILTSEEIAKLLDMLGRFSTPRAIRNQAMLELLYATGIRATELISLDVNMINLDPENPYIKVEHNSKRRTIPIPSRVVQPLQKYLEKVRSRWLGDKEEKALFLNVWGDRLTRQSAWLITKKCAEQAELKDKVSPEILRSSFIFHQSASGMSPEELQKLLGHAWIYTTRERLQTSD